MQEDDQLTNSYFCGAEGVPEGESGIEKEAVKVTEVEERILKRGDLARIIGRKTGKLKDHDGDLGRIIRSFANTENDVSHPFLYDIDLIMGGKLSGLQRSDLLYTTASQEGMIGDSRARRNRKPSAVQEAATAATKEKKEKAKPAKKKPPAKKQKKVAATKTTKKRAAGSNNDKSKSKKAKAAKAPADDPPPTTTTTTMDMYARHRREFERSVIRLEKTDAYHFFQGDVPEELTEGYTKQVETPGTPQENPSSPQTTAEPQLEPNAEAQHNSSSSQSPEMKNGQKSSTKKSKNVDADVNANTIQFPDHPPYNFQILRKRIENGRYELDRLSLEYEERIELIKPYLKSIGKKIPKCNSKKTKAMRLPVLHPIGVDWDLFRKDVIGMCDAAVERNPDPDGSAGTVRHAATKIKEVMEQIYERSGNRHTMEMSSVNDRHRFSLAMDSFNNVEAAMQGKWRREAFSERCYERLKTDAVCAGLSELDERIASYELKTTLKDSFVGLSYTYDDTGQSEGWMKSVLNETGEQSKQQKAALAMSSDDGVIKAQVAASMQSLLIAVQDKVMTEMGVLEQRELRSANWEAKNEKVAEQVVSSTSLGSTSGPEITEKPVWGIDCYTRRNISICLETEFDAETVLTFVEKWLLPAINACPADLAYDLRNAARILEGLPFDNSTSLENDGGTTTEQWSTTLLGKALLTKIRSAGPPWLKAAANLLRKAKDSLGPDFFRVHPKGHGSIVLCQKLEPNRLVTFYRGEVYPSWRWGEKMDAISMIQQKKGLKPVLPDFFNMALERPQMDPRGYGLLFVDASRKSGYGSMLSHSCQPSCEVRVAAVNGELTLAMTTLRKMTIGDELTFDYNAVTESLNEYQSAVCLCGRGQCRGSFLHFATADCYQQVLNRNSPVAVRLANLIKGCMKKVMGEEDERILKRHGFQTAAFGAVSVNRRKATNLDTKEASLDSMDFVPIWLRTYVADTLRYVEYERRALPIALICNELSSDGKDGKTGGLIEQIEPPRVECEEDEDKPIKGSKPEPTFFYYSRTQREHFISILMEKDSKRSLTGIDLKREIQRLASSHWKELDAEKKKYWKKQAIEEWERNGGKEKARLEEERSDRKSKSKNAKSTTKSTAKKESTKQGSSKNEKKKAASTRKDDKPAAGRISFQAADGEGISAMEQRIQQLTQTLSRVGRVLDRHREESLRRKSESFHGNVVPSNSTDLLQKIIHSPLSIMPDEHVVAWMWNHEDGIVRVLLKSMEDEICVSPSLKKSLRETESKHAVLKQFGSPWIEGTDSNYPMSLSEGRERLNEALLEFRSNLLNGIKDTAAEIKNHKASTRKDISRKKEEEAKKNEPKSASENEEKDASAIIRGVMDDLLDCVEQRMTGSTSAVLPQPGVKSESDLTSFQNNEREETNMLSSDNEKTSFDLEPWHENYNKRFKLEKAADILLFYAKTSTFFSLVPYQPLQSSPIEVYARELGNAVPRSAIDQPSNTGFRVESNTCGQDDGSRNDSDDDNKSDASQLDLGSTGKASKRSKSRLCEPEDIIAEVSVEYQGDYVISQLLQWYNAGIDQNPGLPDILGCIMLPSMLDSWKIDGTLGSSSRTDRPTGYHSTTRRRLVHWLKDSHKRGSPWPDDIRRAYVDRAEDKPIANASTQWLPLGSPILDFLVTGDDANINSILHTLGSDLSSASDDSGLLSSVDHGRPAQAVSNWVQCENPECQKWRKIPWHVDIDMLSEKFFCKDNIWNPISASCEAPEDEWNETTDAQVGADGSALIVEEPNALIPPKEESCSAPTCKVSDFRLGARFDVLRTGKDKWCVGVVVKLDLGGALKRVQFHFPKVQIKHDEWVEIDSPRLALLHSKTTRPPQKETASREEKQSTASTGPQKAPKASASDGISRKRPGAKKKTGLQGEKRSNNAKKRKTTEENGSPSNTFQDKSYLHSPKSNTKEIASINKLSTVVSSELESSTLSPPKAVTDESSPEDSQAKKNAEKAKGNSSSWTIPKKKPSTPKTSLLLLSPIPSETASISPEKVVKAKVTALTKENSGERIPRKPIPAAKEERDLSLQDLKGRPQVHDSQFSVHKPSENFKSSVPNRDTRRSADSKYDHSTRPGESYRGRWKSDDGIDHNCRQSVDRHKQQTEDQYQLQRRPTEDGYDQSRRQMPVEGDHRRWNRDGGSDRHRQLAEDEYHCHRRPTEDENDRTRRREDDYDHQRRRRPDGEYETHRWRHTYAEYEPDYNRWRSDVARGSPGKRNRDYNGRDSWHRYNPSDRSPSQRRHLDGNARHGNQPYGSREIFKDRGSRSGNRDETYPDGRIGFYGRDRSNPASPEVVSRSRSYEHGNH